MQIGPYSLENRLVLAPMAGVTDRPFRQLCRRFGAGLAVSEMVSCNARLWDSAKTRRRIDHQGEPTPRSVQIAGADPEQMAQAARFNVAHGAQIIDINMGCPVKKVCNAMAGSALLRDESLVARILDAVVAAVDVPVTLKIRTGWDAAQRNAVTVARIAEQTGVQALAVHGRTRACGFSGAVDYATIGAVKQAVAIPVVANGDIDTPQGAARVLQCTGADGLMIGRGALGRPWIFQSIGHFLLTGECLAEPSLDQVGAIVLGHLDALYSFYGEHTGVRVARKHISWYVKGKSGGEAFRRRFNAVATAGEQLRLLRDGFAQLDDPQGLAA